MNKIIVLLVAAAALVSSSRAEEPASAADSMQKAQKFESKTDKAVSAEYLLFLPKGYDSKGEKKWPLILFLHGAGERGSDVQKVGFHGPPKIVKNKPEFPFIVVSPQCPEGKWWSKEVLMGLLEEATTKYAVDTNRIYLTGLSMGGFGSWSLGLAYPEKFAAIAPICGGGQPNDALLAGAEKSAAIKSLGVWAFHGAKDPVVKLAESEKMVNALKQVGCKDLKLTVYPEAQHDSWTVTYDNPELYDWFLKHSRAK